MKIEWKRFQLRCTSFHWFPGGPDYKETACNERDLGLIPGLGRSPGEGNGNPLQYSCLENLMDRRVWQATCSSWDCKESDTTEWLCFRFSFKKCSCYMKWVWVSQKAYPKSQLESNVMWLLKKGIPKAEIETAMMIFPPDGFQGQNGCSHTLAMFSFHSIHIWKYLLTDTPRPQYLQLFTLKWVFLRKKIVRGRSEVSLSQKESKGDKNLCSMLKNKTIMPLLHEELS